MVIKWTAAAAAVTALAALWWNSAGGGPVEGSAERGKQIYTKGISPSGKAIDATIQLFGGAERNFDAKRYACINCHTPEGIAAIEGGVPVPTIQRFALRAPTHAGNPTGRVRVAYDDATLRRAITMGIDASGNPLQPLMPRFNLSDQDFADLLAYLNELGRDAVPGVETDVVRIATVLDPTWYTKSAVEAVRDTLTAFIAEMNKHGGVYRRALQLEILTAEQWQQLSEDRSRASRYLCAVGPLGLPEGKAPPMPVYGAIQPEPLLPPPRQDGVTWLFPSQLDQARVAIDHYCHVLKKQGVRFHLALEPDVDVEPFEKALGKQAGLYEGTRVTCAPHTAGNPLPEGVVLLILGSPAFKQRVLKDADAGKLAAVYMTHLVPPDLVTSLDAGLLERLRLLLPIPLPEAGRPAVQMFRDFLDRHRMKATMVSYRVAAFAACAALIESLKRCGARVTRVKLAREMCQLYKFHPSLFPPVTFTANRNVGAIGAQVVRFDKDSMSLVALSAWSEPR